MLASKELTIYDSWDINYPSIPTRSRLFQLEPIGIGTPYVESLTSYLARLVESHTVLLGDLAKQEIKPVVPKNYKSRDLFCIKHRTGTVNGTGVIALDLVQALEKLTFREDLTFLTLLKWSQVFPQRQLTRPVKAWCPACYQDWYSQNQVIYDPLLWFFQEVNICLKHKIPLKTCCPHCYSELPPLASNSRPGYCSGCERWLGQEMSINITALENKSWQVWVMNNLGSIVANSPNLSHIAKEQVAQSLQLSIEQTTQGNIAAFARFIGLPKNQVWMWSKGQVLPQLSVLLKICYLLNLSLLEFLTNDKLKVNSCSDLKFVNQERVILKKRITNLIFVEKSLKSILSESPEKPPSLTAVAKQLGFNRRTLTRSFPELCQAISARYLEYRKSCRLQKIQQFTLEIEQAVVELNKKGIYPSESNVSKLLSQPGYFREKEVRAALNKARQKLGIKR
jgi:transcriptional regulator with XRE-family HTH domain